MIELNGIRKTYRQGGNQIHALDGIDLKVGPGEFVAIMERMVQYRSPDLNMATLRIRLSAS